MADPTAPGTDAGSPPGAGAGAGLRNRRSARRALAVVAAVLAVVAVVALRPGDDGPTRATGAGVTPTASAASSPSSPSAPSASGGATVWAPTKPDPNLSTAPAAPSAVPVSIDIPSIGTSSSLIELGTDPATGVLVPPERYDIAGWFDGGPHPGDVGPAIIAGHVDSHLGPGVFFHLRDIAVGAQVLVTRADGSVATFTVYAVGRYPKTAFPTAEVYGPTPDAQLRVITCGGAFDSSVRSYEDNIVAYARLG